MYFSLVSKFLDHINFVFICLHFKLSFPSLFSHFQQTAYFFAKSHSNYKTEVLLNTINKRKNNIECDIFCWCQWCEYTKYICFVDGICLWRRLMILDSVPSTMLHTGMHIVGVSSIVSQKYTCSQHNGMYYFILSVFLKK